MWHFFMVLDTLKKVRAFETSETTHLVTRFHIQKDLNLQQHRCDNLNFISPRLFSKCHVFKGDNVFKYTGFVFRSRDILQHIHFLLSLFLSLFSGFHGMNDSLMQPPLLSTNDNTFCSWLNLTSLTSILRYLQAEGKYF
jgi:hypothetical protein